MGAVDQPYRDPSLPVPVRVSDLLARMTLWEKAGLLFHTMIGVGPDGALAAADAETDRMSNVDMKSLLERLLKEDGHG